GQRPGWTVQPHLDPAAACRGRYPGAERAGAGTERDALDLEVVAVLDPADVHPAFAGRFRLDAALPGHRLRLLARVRVERAGLGCPGRGHVDGREGAVGVVVELLDRHRAGVAAATRQRAIVVEEVGATIEVDDAGVIGKAAALRGHDGP